MRVCAICPVRRDCRRDALVAYQPSNDPADTVFIAYGVWGGTTQLDRLAITGDRYPRGERAQYLREVEVFIDPAEETFEDREDAKSWINAQIQGRP